MKVSLREAVTDFVGEIMNEVYRIDMRERERIKEIIYQAMFRLSLDYMDRADDVAKVDMSREIDSLTQRCDGLLDENRRLREGKGKEDKNA